MKSENLSASSTSQWNECLRPPSPFILSPQERRRLLADFGFTDERSANSVVGVLFQRDGEQSPSPGGEGRGEGGYHLLILILNSNYPRVRTYGAGSPRVFRLDSAHDGSRSDPKERGISDEERR
jgi:hypothetical protein